VTWRVGELETGDCITNSAIREFANSWFTIRRS
jgi:hypothetical protein